MPDVAYISGLQFFARELIVSEFPGNDPDNLVDGLLAKWEINASSLLDHSEPSKLNLLSHSLLQKLSQEPGDWKSIAEEALEDGFQLQAGHGSKVISGVFLIGLVLALRIGTIEAGNDNGVKLTFQSENTKQVIQLVVDLVEKGTCSIENLLKDFGTQVRQIEHDKH